MVLFILWTGFLSLILNLLQFSVYFKNRRKYAKDLRQQERFYMMKQTIADEKIAEITRHHHHYVDMLTKKHETTLRNVKDRYEQIIKMLKDGPEETKEG